MTLPDAGDLDWPAFRLGLYAGAVLAVALVLVLRVALDAPLPGETLAGPP